jgi:hypothetical protein
MQNVRIRSVVEQVTGCSELMDLEASDGGNADALVWLYGGEFLYVEELGWMHYNGQYCRRYQAKQVQGRGRRVHASIETTSVD